MAVLQQNGLYYCSACEREDLTGRISIRINRRNITYHGFVSCVREIEQEKLNTSII